MEPNPNLKFEQMLQEGKFSEGLKALQKVMTLCLNHNIDFSVYQVIGNRCKNIVSQIILKSEEFSHISRSDLEDFQEKSIRLSEIVKEFRQIELISKILEPRNDYDLLKQAE